MKTIAGTVILALFVISIASPEIGKAQAGGRRAYGGYRFVMEDNLTKSVEFDASTDERGTTTGAMSFSDQAGASEEEPETPGDPKEGPPTEFTITASLDSLVIENNRAMIGGTITASSHQSYIGRWVQLVVEDGREGPDQLNWRLCQVEPGGWVPADAEDPRDEGAYWHWWATDAELREDVGIPSVNIIPGLARGCPTFPISIYEFPEVRGEGQIQVVP